MSEREFVLAIIGMVGGFLLVWGCGYVLYDWLRNRWRGRGGADTQALQEQIAQLQVSVDTMAVELERISEGQRFTTRLLTERQPAARVERGDDAR